MLSVPGGVGYVAPWMDVEIVEGNRKSAAKGELGEIRVRRRTDMQSVWRSSAAGGEGWIYPGQRGRRLMVCSPWAAEAAPFRLEHFPLCADRHGRACPGHLDSVSTVPP